uniref:Uncharacterized protein n=1 Tax=Kalanchoe fedtschenkoi TaxID=63787 RepID=A0A7N0SYD0_KALFE
MAGEGGGAGNAGLDVVVGVKDGLMMPSSLPNPQAHFSCGGLGSYARNPSRYAREQPGHMLPQQHSKPSSRPGRPRLTKQQGNWVTGGPGMQAIFLDSAADKKSSGTGVFLPQIRPDNQLQPSKRPACAAVLLPARVVQALNLNMHDLGLQITPPRKELDDLNMKKRVEDLKREESIGEPTRGFSEKECSSPEILFLPKEWTY